MSHNFISLKDRIFLYLNSTTPCIAEVISVNELQKLCKISFLESYGDLNLNFNFKNRKYFDMIADYLKVNCDYDTQDQESYKNMCFLRNFALHRLKLLPKFNCDNDFLNAFIGFKIDLETGYQMRSKKRKRDSFEQEIMLRKSFPLQENNLHNFIFSSCQYLFDMNLEFYYNKAIYKIESIFWNAIKIGFAIYHADTQFLMAILIERKYWKKKIIRCISQNTNLLSYHP